MLTVKNLHKKYEGKPLLSGIDFEVRPGETICLLGRSGSGKSTILRIIAGIEKPEEGKVLWNGEDLAGLPVHKRNFGLMFQDYALFPHRNVAENIAFGLRMQNQSADVVHEKVRSALEQMNLIGFENRRVNDLSGGEQQRVALARALAPQPRLLMLDEPLGALDRTLKEQLMQELRMLLHRTNIPAIYVTHDQEEAFTIGDRLILLKDGTVQQEGTPVDLYNKPNSAWVAKFFGLGNLLEGKIINLDPLTISTKIGEMVISSSFERVKVGRPVQLLLRPNAAKLCNGNDFNCLPAIVMDSIFLGSGYRVKAKMGNQEFNFQFDVPLETKKSYNFYLDPSAIQCFFEE